MIETDYTAYIGNNGTLKFKSEIENWKAETPVPIDRHLLQAMPDDTFGGWLGDTIMAVAASLELPPEFAATMALPAVATCVQGKFSLLVEEEYYEPLNIWTIATMGPSNRKSSCCDFFVAPLRQWERDQAKAMKPIIDEATSVRETMEGIIKEARKKASKLVSIDERKEAIEEIKKLESELPSIPVYPSLLFDDATAEVVAYSLSVNGERLSYIESEADALFGMLNGRYSGNENFDLVLRSRRGEGKRVTRRHAPPIDLDNPLLTIGIAPQPGLIVDQMKNPMLVKRGFFARFLMVVPQSKLGFRDLKSRPVSDSIKLAYETRILTLLSIESNTQDGRQVPYIVRLSNLAYQSWKSFQRRIEAMMAPGNRLSDEALVSWGGKLAGYVASVAALIQIGEQVGIRPDEKLIEVGAMDRAIAFGEVLVEHAIAFHDLADQCPGLSKARQLLKWLQGQERKSEVTVREIQQSLKHRSSFPRAGDVREGLEVLRENGWVLPKPDLKIGTGRKKEIYLIHPGTYPRNPQNRKTESTGENETSSGDNGDGSASFKSSKSAIDNDETEVVF